MDGFTSRRKSSRSNGTECAEVGSWRKSARSEAGNCAEAGTCRHGVAVRDSKDPDGPVLTFGRDEWKRWTGRIKAGPSHR